MTYLEELIDYDVNGKPKKRLLVDSVSGDLSARNDLGVGSVAYARSETNKVQLKISDTGSDSDWEAL